MCARTVQTIISREECFKMFIKREYSQQQAIQSCLNKICETLQQANFFTNDCQELEYATILQKLCKPKEFEVIGEQLLTTKDINLLKEACKSFINKLQPTAHLNRKQDQLQILINDLLKAKIGQVVQLLADSVSTTSACIDGIGSAASSIGMMNTFSSITTVPVRLSEQHKDAIKEAQSGNNVKAANSTYLDTATSVGLVTFQLVNETPTRPNDQYLFNNETPFLTGLCESSNVEHSNESQIIN